MFFGAHKMLDCLMFQSTNYADESLVLQKIVQCVQKIFELLYTNLRSLFQLILDKLGQKVYYISK